MLMQKKSLDGLLTWRFRWAMMVKKKRHLTKAEEFDIMKIVLDKFLLLGVFIMALGLYLIVTQVQDFAFGFAVLGTGAIVMIIFAMILVREYNFMEN